MIARTVSLSMAVLLLVGAYSGIASGQQDGPNDNGTAETPYDLAVTTETVVPNLGSGLENWCGVTFEFLPDGRIICGELRGGKVRMIDNNVLLPDPLLQLDIYTGYKNPPDCTIFDEQGLIGLALDPNFEENQYVYLHWTYQVGDTVDCGNTQSAKQVARFTLVDNKLVDKKVLLDGIPGAKQHVGGPLEFGPDGKLYITGGEAGMRTKAQDMESPLGKILRINPDGSIPDDNPFPGKPYYTIGHRNSFGIAFHPVTGVPYNTENGPDTNDEINILYAGKNYGWPDVLGTSDDERYVSPIFDTGPGTIAPTEMEFYTGDKYPDLVNDMFFLSYNYRSLDRIVLEPPNFDKVIAHYRYQLPTTGIGSYTDIEMGSDGYLYVSDFKSISRVLFEYRNMTTTIQLDPIGTTSTGSLTSINAKVTDYFGKPVADAPLNFQASGTSIGTASTNQEGVARLVYTPTSAGEFSITATFDGNEKYRAATSQAVNLTVQGSTTSQPQILEAMTENSILVRLSLEPPINQNDNSTLKFGVKLVDPRTENELQNVPYVVEIVKERASVFSQQSVTGQGVVHEYKLNQTGPAEIVIKDINSTADSVRFSVNIVPEFPAQALLVPVAALAVVVLLMNSSKLKRVPWNN